MAEQAKEFKWKVIWRGKEYIVDESRMIYYRKADGTDLYKFVHDDATIAQFPGDNECAVMALIAPI